MAATVAVSYDRGSGILVQHITGVMTIDDYDRLESITAECLRENDNGPIVRILIDSNAIRPLPQSVRRHAFKRLDARGGTEQVYLAFWRGSRLDRVFMKFITIMRGNDRVRSFDTEQQARQWLVSVGTKGQQA